jgi:hypothetical protein
MENENFIYKSYCELAIVSNAISPELITEELGVLPSRTFRKGDQSVSKHSGSIIIKPHNLWALKSNIYQSEEETINYHIDFFRSALKEKLNILMKYKNDTCYDISFCIWIETDNSGIGLNLEENQMAFLNNISNRIRMVFISTISKAYLS